MASIVTKYHFRCVATADLIVKDVAEASAATVGCNHLNIGQNLSGMFLTLSNPCHEDAQQS